jgi:hypothetical protein
MMPWTLLPRWSWIVEAAASRRLAIPLIAACGGVVVQGAEPTPGPQARARFVDSAIVTAGGVGCTSCGPGGCRGGRHGHHAGCRDGVCVPYCPVRPQQFGYYGTRWRKWPGQEILQVSDEREAAPVVPPRSEVPGADEESMTPRDVEAAAEPDADAPATLPPQDQQPEATARPAVEPAPAAAPEPAPTPQPTPAPEPGPVPTPEPKPAAEPKPARPEDENLFEVLSGSGWRAKRRFPVNAASGAAGDAESSAGIQPMNHLSPTGQRDVPRVPFDRAAETRLLRSAR